MQTVRTSGSSKTQVNTVLLKNRFYILDCGDPEVPDVTLCRDSPSNSCQTFTFSGKKNGNGQKLGQATKQDHIKVDHLAKPFRGNKNKTGKNLGLNSTEGLGPTKICNKKCII